MTATLYHYPFACSTACRLAAAEAQTPIDVERVDIYTKELERGGSYFEINPLGQVAALRFDDGQILTENTAILLWIDTNGRTNDSSELDFSLVSWIGFCATEIHKQILWPLFRQDVPAAVHDYVRALAPVKLDHVDRYLRGRSFLVGHRFSAADAYLLWALRLTKTAGIDLDPFQRLRDYDKRLRKRPRVAAVLEDDREGLAQYLRTRGVQPYAKNPARARVV